MSTSKIPSQIGQTPQVVGTIHSEGSLRRALRLKAGSVDLLELRVDCFSAEPRALLRAVPRLEFPLIVTVRHPAEGGVGHLELSKRRALFLEFLPCASIIDVELRSVEKLQPILALARERGIKVLVSNHHFHSTPTAQRLAQLAKSARGAGADIFKLAALASTPADLANLLSLFPGRLPISVMGMGALGKVSRLLFAQAGSVLNYGYLDQPNASGQWDATLLKSRLAELKAE